MEIRTTIENHRKNPPEIIPQTPQIETKIQKIVKKMYDGLRCAQKCEKLVNIGEKKRPRGPKEAPRDAQKGTVVIGMGSNLVIFGPRPSPKDQRSL